MADLAPLLFSVALGIGLAAACGLRVFLPLFVTSVLAHFDVGGTGLREGFSWLASGPAMIALGTAMVVEVLAYYIPLLDHALDVIAVPLSTAAGTLVAISTMVDLPPGLAWGLAIVAGGGVAGLVSAGTAITRVASTTTTGGLGNPVVATAESGAAVTLSLVAWFVPVLALVVVILLLWLSVRWLAGRWSGRRSR